MNAPAGSDMRRSSVVAPFVIGGGMERRAAYSMTRLVKNGLVISLTEGSSSLESPTVMNSFSHRQQCQRFWTSRALTRSSHSRLIKPEPHLGHFLWCGLEIDAISGSPASSNAQFAHLALAAMI
jgi:hypothetical protein